LAVLTSLLIAKHLELSIAPFVVRLEFSLLTFLSTTHNPFKRITSLLFDFITLINFNFSGLGLRGSGHVVSCCLN
jgi:hypothetical protein